MNITLDKTNSQEALIKVQIEETDYQDQVNEKIKEYRKKASIKGFRPGKVPASLIKKMYGKSILADELNTLLNKSLTDYIQKEDLNIIGEPLPKEKNQLDLDLDNQKAFEFEYEIGLVGDFEVSMDKPLTYYKIKIDKKQVEEQIEDLKKQYGPTIEAEKVAEGDVINGKLVQKEGEIERDTIVTLDMLQDKAKKSFSDKKIGDTVEFDIRETFKDDESIARVTDLKAEEAKELNGLFTFTIAKINRQEVAELNQEFFDKLFGPDQVKSEDEFRQKIEDTFKQNYQQESDQLLRLDSRKTLVDNTKIDIPDTFFKKWLLATNQDKLTEEELEKDLDKYIDELKWMLISNKLMAKYDLKVENSEIEERAKSLFRNYLYQSGLGSAEMEANLSTFAENYLKAENGKNYMNLMEQVKGEKVYDAIKDNSEIKEKEISLDDFKKEAEARS